ncbi:MAG: trypsin-like peptidase domain-containing protein [Geobacteraceae bacterium]|nr:trypsin-like peptidase domain-containing protein [Geobacteraceae bacterium]
MMRDLFRLFLVIFVIGVLGACSSSKDEPLFFKSKRPAAEAEPPVKDVPADILSTQRAFSQVSKKVTPIVVNISTISRKKLVRPFPDMPPLFEEFFGGAPQARRDKSLGSGFIISRDGFIVTNEHVVRDAESIRVKLSNDKVYEARVVGGDPKTDIAVIKINATDLPVAVLGDSDRIEVGQWAIAIGNPFGLERSMTVGVISATGRSNVGIESIENFIQTDASINPGNSGGPLLNIHGEVVGINTAIVAAGQGIGFAIPTNMARPIISQLVEKGKVTRAWLGVSIKPVSEDDARSLGLPKPVGVLIAGVQGDGPAAKAGIRAGDIVLVLGGTEVRDPSHLQQLVAVTRIGATLPVVVLRDGRKVTVTVKPGNADNAASARRIDEDEGVR